MSQKKKTKRKKSYHNTKDPIMRRSDIPFAQRSNLRHKAKVNFERERAARVALYCASIAVHKTEGVGYRRLGRLSYRYMRYEEEVYRDGVEVGLIRAKKRMDEIGMSISGELYPVPDMGGTVREQDIANQTMEATQVALTVVAIAIHDEFGYAKIPQDRIHDQLRLEVETYGKKGMTYLLDEMKKIGFEIRNGKAVFYADADENVITRSQAEKLVEEANKK